MSVARHDPQPTEERLPGSDAPAVTVVVPTFRRPDRLARLVASLERQTMEREAFELVVVDNGSGDETTEVLHRLASTSAVSLRPLRIEDNRGPARARNYGWRMARSDYVAFTDDDCVPHPDWLERGVEALRAKPCVGVVQGVTLMADGHRPSGGWEVNREVLRPSAFFEGCNLFFRRAALEMGGGFDETLHFGGEDTVAGWSALEAGWDRDFAYDAVVYHDVEVRDLRWHLRMAWWEGNLVTVASRHPRFRQEGLWRPWAIHPKAVRFAACLLGLELAIVIRRAWPLVLTVPWLRKNIRPTLAPAAWKLLIERFAVDLVRSAGTGYRSARERCLVL